jgi:phosphate transport system substrate-binding protein
VVTGTGRRGGRLRAAAFCIAAGTALAAALAACGGPVSGVPVSGVPVSGSVLAAQRETIKETGSTLLYPLMRVWAQAYEGQHPGVTVTTAGTGSGAGITAASTGTADIGASDAYLSSGDLVKAPALLNIPLAVSAQTVIYNLPHVTAHVSLNGTVLAGIYSGTITTWNDPAIERINPGVSLPATRIVPFHRFDSSGDTFLFASYLSTQDSAWNSAIGYGTTVNWPVPGEHETGNGNMVAGCAATPGCVAYVGISYLGGVVGDGLGEARLANAAGNYELPTAQAVGAALSSFVSLTPPNETISLIDGPAPDGYPVINYEYAVVSARQPSAAKASALAAFLTWLITDGNTPATAYLDQVGFQPLPSALVTLGKQQIEEIKGP